MRTLKFIVNQQTITQDPKCDFSGLIPGTEDYLQAEFIFSSEWSGCRKVAGFYSVMGTEFEPKLLADGKTCKIPSEALKRKTFKVKVFGKRDKMRLETNKVAVCQNGDGV
jgi:hypothetical protein